MAYRFEDRIWEDEEFWETGLMSGRQAVEGETFGGLADGILAGTLIATAAGWRPAETIMPGDEVLTFDEGLKPVRDVARSVLWTDPGRCPDGLRPLTAPEGALGNKAEMSILPEQYVLIESETAGAVFGDPYVLVPAAALEGYRGIFRRRASRRSEVIRLHFDDDQIVYAEGLGLMHCPASRGKTLAERGRNLSEAACYTMLPLADAKILMGCAAEDGPRPDDV